MARQPEVFVRSLEPEEAQRLVKITRTARNRVRLRRAGIVLASAQGRSAADAAAMFAATAQYAREVIHAFNEQGFAALDLASGQMFYRFRDRKRWREFLGFLNRCEPGSRTNGSTSCATTSPHIRRTRSPGGARPTAWIWCSRRATRRG